MTRRGYDLEKGLRRAIMGFGTWEGQVAGEDEDERGVYCKRMEGDNGARGPL